MARGNGAQPPEQQLIAGITALVDRLPQFQEVQELRARKQNIEGEIAGLELRAQFIHENNLQQALTERRAELLERKLAFERDSAARQAKAEQKLDAACEEARMATIRLTTLRNEAANIEQQNVELQRVIDTLTKAGEL